MVPACTPNGMELRAGLDVRAGTGRTLHGVAAPFNRPASIGGRFQERVLPGAFKATLGSGRDVLALADHDPARLLGRTRSGSLQLEERGDGLHFALDLPRTSLGDDVLALAQRGDLGGVSIGFRPVDEAWPARDQRELRGVELHEISIIASHPAYGDTSIAVRLFRDDLMVDPGSAAAHDRARQFAHEQDMAVNLNRRRMLDML